LGRIGAGWPRNLLAWYLSLMVAYGVANAANDAWIEQIVKRGWTDWRIPSMLRPGISIAWGLVVLAVVVLRILAFRPEPLASETDSGAPNVGGEFEPKQMATSSR
jgi:hypothetical protein